MAKKPSVADCLDEIRRLRAENERLKRLVQTQRPDIGQLRALTTLARDMTYDLHTKLHDLTEASTALLGNGDDLPSIEEISGCFGPGVDRVNVAIRSRHPALDVGGE